MHGGATPRGTESPHYKHGLYSRYAAPALAARIAELRQEEDRLHDLREVLAVQGALLGEALAQDNLAAAAALTEAVSRSIDRYHKHNPPEDSLGAVTLSIRKRVAGEYDKQPLSPEQVQERYLALTRELQELEREGGHITRIERVIVKPANPMHGTGSGNP